MAAVESSAHRVFAEHAHFQIGSVITSQGKLSSTSRAHRRIDILATTQVVNQPTILAHITDGGGRVRRHRRRKDRREEPASSALTPNGSHCAGFNSCAHLEAIEGFRW
jgi:hypothetical protein